MNMIPLLLALAAAPAETDIGPALQACEELPIEQQRACVEPWLDRLPPRVAEMLRYETDPVLHAARQQWEQELDAALRGHAKALAARGGARNLLGAALVWPIPEPSEGAPRPVQSPEAVAWFAAAQAAVPPDPAVDRMVASGCGLLADTCDRDAAIARLIVADPGNIALHLLALNQAVRRNDEAAIALHLHEAAAAERYESYFPVMLELLSEAHEGMAWPAPDPVLGKALAAMWGAAAPVTADDYVAIRAFGHAMAVAYPGLGPVTGLCPVDGSGNPAFRRDCMALYSRVAGQADMVMDRVIALVHLSQLTAGDPAGDAWREQLRDLYWLQHHNAALMPGMPGSGITGAEYLRLWLAGGELGAMKEVLRRNDIAIAPPADWLPDQPRQRALVTTGTPAR